MSNKPSAPKENIKWNATCKAGCKSCKCTCKRHGLECTPACGDTKLSVVNIPNPLIVTVHVEDWSTLLKAL